MELKFNSQICTNVEQSNRLLELGLKPETADMCFFRSTDEDLENSYTRIVVDDYMLNALEDDENIPAWSLHRLLVILNPPIVEFAISSLEEAYEDVIYNISESIKNGYINKEYLKQSTTPA